jgi:hypothetical protein
MTIRKVIAIGYLPMALVRQNFLLLIKSRRTRRLQCQFPELLDFFNYFAGLGLVMVFNATFNNISVISWRSVLVVEKTGIPIENH